MITPDYVKTLAAYNAAMNKRTYAGAARLSDDDRRRDQGAFFKSLQGTLNHLLWADRMWMSRFDGWPQPGVLLRDSPGTIDDFDLLQAERETADRGILEWSTRVSPEFLTGDTAWFSGATQRDMKAPTAGLVVHMFNHQTHHRGQAHALLTRAGIDIGVTDLWLVV